MPEAIPGIDDYRQHSREQTLPDGTVVTRVDTPRVGNNATLALVYDGLQSQKRPDVQII